MTTNPNLKASDRVTVLDVINPQSATTAKSTAWLPANTHESYLFALLVGTIASTGTVDAKLEQATDSSGTSAKDITGKAITQLTQAGTDSDKQALINLKADELDINNSFSHFRLTVTPATAAALIGAVVLGLDPRYAPGTADTTVDEVVT